jgi:hypothetical protein
MIATCSLFVRSIRSKTERTTIEEVSNKYRRNDECVVQNFTMSYPEKLYGIWVNNECALQWYGLRGQVEKSK